MFRTDSVETFLRLQKEYPKYVGDATIEWLDGKNKLFESDGSVGMFTYNYPGVYTGHWFFKVRGRQALNLARAMLAEAFEDDVRVVIGVTERDLPAARWAARQLGMTSHGFLDYPKYGECEFFTLTKQEFESKD